FLPGDTDEQRAGRICRPGPATVGRVVAAAATRPAIWRSAAEWLPAAISVPAAVSVPPAWPVAVSAARPAQLRRAVRPPHRDESVRRPATGAETPYRLDRGPLDYRRPCAECDRTRHHRRE